jgi:hypothetical protein
MQQEVGCRLAEFIVAKHGGQHFALEFLGVATVSHSLSQRIKNVVQIIGTGQALSTGQQEQHANCHGKRLLVALGQARQEFEVVDQE